MAFDFDAALPILRELYSGQKLQNVLYPDNPMWAWLPKKPVKFVGSTYPVPIVYGNPQLVSASASQAFGSTPTSTRAKRFSLSRKFKYGAARITREILKAADGNLGSFIDGAQLEMDGSYNAVGRRLAQDAYRDGTGCIGIIPSGAAVDDAGGVLKIGPYSGGAQGGDIDNFESGMELVAAHTVTGSLRTGSMFVVAVDRLGSTITVAATDGGTGADPSSLISGLAATDYLFVKGDAANGTGVLQCTSGVDAWLPFSLAAGDSFNGVNRNADNQRLAGVHLDATTGSLANAPLAQIITRGTALAGKFGGRPRVGFCNWELWTSLINELGSKVMYGQVDAYERADIGFQSVKVHGGREPVEIVPDVNCPAGRIYLLDESSWGLYSADGDEVIQIVREDGLTMLRSTGADAFDMRLASELEIGCNAPGKNCVIKVN